MIGRRCALRGPFPQHGGVQQRGPFPQRGGVQQRGGLGRGVVSAQGIDSDWFSLDTLCFLFYCKVNSIGEYI